MDGYMAKQRNEPKNRKHRASFSNLFSWKLELQLNFHNVVVVLCWRSDKIESTESDQSY